MICKHYNFFLKWGLWLSLLPNIRHGGYTHSSNWNGSEPVAPPHGQAASCVWVHRPTVSSLSCQGRGVIHLAVGSWSWPVPPANQCCFLYDWAGAQARSWPCGQYRFHTLTCVLSGFAECCWCWFYVQSVGSCERVSLPLVIVQFQEKRCKSPCAIQHEEEAFSWWQVDGMKKKGKRFAVFQLFIHVQQWHQGGSR